MPTRNPSPCSTPNCPRPAPAGANRCTPCRGRHRAQRAHLDAAYDTLWRDTSRRYLDSHPSCEWPDCTARSHDVDHIDGAGPAGPRGHDWTNLRALCRPHHSRRTAADTRFGRHT